jgi:hypothetical protein
VIRRTTREKAEWVLYKFSPGELQSHVSIKTPVKTGRKVCTVLPSGEKKYAPIVIISRRVDSTGIPASTLSRFKTKKWVPREKSLKKLAAFYDKYMYNHMRASGLNKEDARKNHTLPPSETLPIIYQYKKWAEKIQDNNFKMGREVMLEHILWGMAHSTHTINDWYDITLTSGLQKK